VLVFLIVVYVGSQLGSTLVATATADANQRRLMLILPFVFIVFLYRFPAGLLVYWITTNLWTVGQQLVIRRYMGAPPTPTGKAGDEPGKGPSRDGKPPPSPRGQTQRRAGAGGSRRARGRAARHPPRPPRKKKKRSGRRR